MDNFHIRTGLFNGIELILENDVVGLDGTVEDGELAALHLPVHNFLGHGVEGGDAAAAGQRDDVFAVAKRFPVEETEGQRTLKLVPDLHILKEIVRDKIGDVAADRDFEEGVLTTRFIRGGGNGVGTGENTLADLQAEVYILAALEHGDVSVGRLKAEDAGSGRGLADIDDLEGHVLGVQLVCQLANRIPRIDDRRALGKVFFPQLGDAGGSADVLQESFDFNAHFFAASFFFSRSSRTALAAARPLVICGPMPSPLIPCAPANSRPSMK